MYNTDTLEIVSRLTRNIKDNNPSNAFSELDWFCDEHNYNLVSIKEDFLKVSDLTDMVKKLKELDQQGLALVLAHNAYTVGAALTGCMYTNPEDYDPVHTLACITDALACILVLKELKGDSE